MEVSPLKSGQLYCMYMKNSITLFNTGILLTMYASAVTSEVADRAKSEDCHCDFARATGW